MSGFNHSAALTLVVPATLTQAGPTIVTIELLQMQFSIERTLKKEPNNCTLSISNLNERSRAEIQRRPLRALLDVAFEGEPPQRLFDGDVRWSESRQDGPTWVTELELGDGERAYRLARVNYSMRGGTPVMEAVAKVIDLMGLKSPSNLSDLVELRQRQFASGVTLHGKGHKELTRLLAPFDIDWSIQNGQIQLLRAAEAASHADVPVSEQDGLIGLPEYGSPPPKGTKPTLHFSMQMNALLTPGRAARIDARGYAPGANRFKLTRVVHDGNTDEGPWESRCEALPL